MDISKLNQTLIEEPIFRLKQAKRAVFVNLVDNWDQTTNFSKKLRDELNKNCPISIKAEFLKSIKSDSLKALITLSDGLKIETVLLSHGVGRNTICLSSQVGCAIGCSFCATGKRGFKRNLTAEEMIEQIILFARLLKKRNQRVNNVVFMGMGEPFLNYDNVLKTIKILNNKDYFNIGARHISISTIGIIDGIKKLATQSLQINLAISLHAPNNNLRAQIIPINKQYPLDKIINAINYYINKTNRRVMIEYVMIKDFNDSVEQARQLIELLKQISKPLYFVNLIFCNSITEFKPSEKDKIKQFREILVKQKIETTLRYSFGQDIQAACGQLIGS
ncbi:MAG: 23S rRNA (adenine(2503)-C(2))-methyltransferase RlmN [Patescibacteria group bacterium]|nr:23S rRNA (adenine(2503)-C(2))-methyltransferase RlmN [Patescibacteria group bacterium]MBU1871118.1 23S rRNA (adenine(2503)-C(2))-methyltransferase RlmN [Patescibacteria group bacterium]